MPSWRSFVLACPATCRHPSGVAKRGQLTSLSTGAQETGLTSARAKEASAPGRSRLPQCQRGASASDGPSHSTLCPSIRTLCRARAMLVSGCTPPLVEQAVAKPRRPRRCAAEAPHASADRPSRQLWTSQPRSPVRGRGRTRSAAPGGRQPPATHLLVPLAVPQGTQQQQAPAPIDDATCDSLIAVSALVAEASLLTQPWACVV